MVSEAIMPLGINEKLLIDHFGKSLTLMWDLGQQMSGIPMPGYLEIMPQDQRIKYAAIKSQCLEIFRQILRGQEPKPVQEEALA